MQSKCEDTAIQLTARCGGFFEVSSLHRGASRDSLVQYFHKTARHFIEPADCWSILLAQTRRTGFEAMSH
jgi:hypothetical protein